MPRPATSGPMFLLDMSMRLFVGARYTPSLVIGSLIVRRQRSEWVGAEQKKLAWILGLVLAFVSCTAMGFLSVAAEIQVAMCSTCVGLLFIENAFGICVGRELQRLFSREKPQLCAGDRCTYVPPRRGERHTVLH
jgi:protein-S-isoprenylcysteine O-methyltransferase Ste14